MAMRLILSAVVLACACRPEQTAVTVDPAQPVTATAAIEADRCEDATIELGPLPYFTSSTTLGRTDDYNLSLEGTCAGGGSQYADTGLGPDTAYRILVDQTCDLQVSMTSVAEDMNVSVYTDCGDLPGSCLGVDDYSYGGYPEDVYFTAVGGTEYFILVDGYNGGTDDFSLSVTETTSTGCSFPQICTGGNDGAFCLDSNACTDNEGCSGTSCVGIPNDSLSCDDGNACTDNDGCTGGACTGTNNDSLPCSDGNACTDDVCSSGSCVGTPNDANPCDDGDPCTDDTCTGGTCVGAPNAERSCVSCNEIPFSAGSLPFTDSGDTTDTHDLYNLQADGSCAGGGYQYSGTGNGPEAVYRIRVDQTCDLEAEVLPYAGVDLGIYIVTDCDDLAASCIWVEDYNGPGWYEYFDFTAFAGTTYFVILDGYGGSEGGYDFTLTETSATGCVLIEELVICDGTNDGLRCDDDNPCTDSEICVSGTCQGTANDTLPCDDDNACTENDGCSAGVCGGTPNDTLPCSDDNACTESDSCNGGTCAGVPNDALPCTDGNPCTDDACNSGSCLGIPDDGNTCSDGIPCTTDACIDGACIGTTKDCSHLNAPCKLGFCNRITGFCEVGVDDDGTACDDNDRCTTDDVCSVGSCAGTPLDCSSLDDGLCQVGVCDPGAGACVAGQRDCSAVDQMCNPGVCNPSDGSCAPAPGDDGEPCDDSDPCTEVDTCGAGTCAGTARDCNDDCNTGTCNPSTGACDLTPANEGGLCDDGDACTGADICAAGTCAGSALDCSGIDTFCARGVCDAATGQCVADARNEGLECDDADPCTKLDICVSGTCTGEAKDCSAFDEDCKTGTCNATTGDCQAVPVADGTLCDDGDPCTTDACQSGVCIGAGTCSTDDGGPTGPPGGGSEPGGCGCAAQPNALPWLLSLLLLPLRRRREVRP